MKVNYGDHMDKIRNQSENVCKSYKVFIRNIYSIKY